MWTIVFDCVLYFVVIGLSFWTEIIVLCVSHLDVHITKCISYLVLYIEFVSSFSAAFSGRRLLYPITCYKRQNLNSHQKKFNHFPFQLKLMLPTEEWIKYLFLSLSSQYIKRTHKPIVDCNIKLSIRLSVCAPVNIFEKNYKLSSIYCPTPSIKTFIFPQFIHKFCVCFTESKSIFFWGFFLSFFVWYVWWTCAIRIWCVRAEGIAM